jgi:hypothetical protein
MELQSFIDQAIEQTETRQAKEAARQAELAAKRQAAWQSAICEATAARLEEITHCYPAALRPYIKADVRFCLSEFEFEKWDNTWRPDKFEIDAPGLAPISFSVYPDDKGVFQPCDTCVWDDWNERSHGHFYDWAEAVAVAAKIHRAQVERDEADRKRREGKEREEAAITVEKPASTAERLATLIEEIIVNKVSELMEVAQ